MPVNMLQLISGLDNRYTTLIFFFSCYFKLFFFFLTLVAFDLMRALKLDLQHHQAMAWILLGALNNLEHICNKSLLSPVQCFQPMLVMTEYRYCSLPSDTFLHPVALQLSCCTCLCKLPSLWCKDFWAVRDQAWSFAAVHRCPTTRLEAVQRCLHCTEL